MNNTGLQMINATYRPDDEIDFSDEENQYDQYNHDVNDWRNFQLRFGKHKGRSLQFMIHNPRDRSYLRYVLKWDDIRPNTAENIRAALSHYEEEKKKRP